MYVNPNSTIILCKNVPLDNTYQHTIYFANATAQATYFQSKAIVTLNNQTYQRVERGKMRVQVNAEEIYTCNYLMFKNTAYGSKWFYAFVTGVEYVNDVTSEITFELDSLQTYWFDTTLMPSFVEREHTNDDTIGANLVEEGLGSPELCVMDTYARYWMDGDWKVAIQIKPSVVWQGGDVVKFAQGYDQFYPTTYEEDISAQGAANLNAWLVQHATDFEVTNCYMFPAEFGQTIAPIPITDLNERGIKRPTAFYDYTSNTALPREYTPKNNKLFTSPYTQLKVASSTGETADFKWEYTKEGYVKFNLHHLHINEPCCELRPTNYYRNASSRLNSIPINDFPKVSLSQFESLKGSNIQQLVNGIIGTMVTTAVNPVAGGVSLLRNVESIQKSFEDTGTKSVATTGGNLDLKYQSFGYIFYQMGITAQDAELIDNFFSMFGYATKKIKVPNIHVRQNWTYTKTVGCVVKSNAPADDVRKICQIFDNGITFWSNPNNVGNYGNLDNPII